MRRPLQVRFALTLSLLVILGLVLSSCGSGETTVTVTETVASKSGKKNTGGAKNATPDIEEGVVAGYVDFSKVEGDSLILSGWAASGDLSEPATQVAARVGSEVVAEAVPAIKREDVVEALGEPGVMESGFELRLPLGSLDCGAPAAGVQVIGSLDGKSSVLAYGEGIKQTVTDAC
jgi:hypothetical protein